MAALGLRGTGAFATNGTPGSSDQRPKNWREMMLLLFPNGEMPLTALLSKLASQGTDDPEFNWWEKGLPTQRTTVNNGAGYASGATSIVVADGSIFKKGHVVLVERTKEVIFIAADPTGNTLGTIVRGKGEVAAAALVDTDPLYIIGTVHEEGADSPNIITYSPTKVYNYCQIFRTTLGQTRTAKKTRLRWDATGPYREAKREALQLHGIEMEKAFIYGQRLEETGPDGQPRRTTRGVRTFITTNVLTDIDTNGSFTEADFTRIWEEVFRYGSNEKFAFTGSTAVSVLNSWAKSSNIQVNMDMGSKTYGMHIASIVTPFGILHFKLHPLMSEHPTYRKDMLIVDLPFLKYRYVDDTTFKTNVQSPGVDSSKDEFLTEAGLEMWHEKAHSLITNMTSYA